MFFRASNTGSSLSVMPSIDAGGIEHQDVVAPLAIEREPGDLQPARVDHLSTGRPHRRRVVERIAVGGQLDPQVEHHRFAVETRRQLVVEEVGRSRPRRPRPLSPTSPAAGMR